MAKKKRQRISYVLPLASSPGGHRLGVNGLAVDEHRSILYSGGRDGVICAWDLNGPIAETAASGPVATTNGHSSVGFHSQVQAHTHWVNDVVLAQNNEALVSASSDVTVKVWRPHGTDRHIAHTIGLHSDYVKCLATPEPSSTWVASGGLDHKIFLWDLNGAGQTLEIDVGKAGGVTKGSIYALCAKGSILASGGPEGVVRLWDAKSGKNVTKLVGHTDNVRDILMSDDGEMLLTASSDQTVKVWSVAAGRCMYTLTMHNDSVWSLSSKDPRLAVFYSSDRSGLVAKTDTRHADEFDEGISVAVCQEHDGVADVVVAGDHIWTVTQSSSINRWDDVDTTAEIETPPTSPRLDRTTSASSRVSPPHSPTTTTPTQEPGLANGHASENQIPFTSVLRLSVTAPHPARRHHDGPIPHSPPSLRKASEAILDGDLGVVIPIRSLPSETIEGQNGLIKHVMLNDRKRVLTLDTEGEVVLWDLLKCTPIRSFGRRHLDDVVPEVNTTESVANWCAVDTRTGKLSVILEENYCFDAEVYADEIDVPEKIEFREDQRINLGKWVLRNLFTTLLDEEIKRDEIYRRAIREGRNPDEGVPRENAPPSISLPPATQATSVTSPSGSVTPRANGTTKVPMTPGLAIGLATPSLATANQNGPVTAIHLPTTAEEGSDTASDYFSAPVAGTPDLSVDSTAKLPSTPGESTVVSTPASPMDGTEEKKKSGLFGKKFQMAFPKKLGRNSAEVKQAPVNEEKTEDLSDKSSEKEEKILEDNFFGVIQRIRNEYDELLEVHPDHTLTMGITPSQPMETPVLRPPPRTLIIIQEDNPGSGGLADLYRGEISQLGTDADILEKVAPMWLGDLLLRNQIPFKDTVKVSFVLQPYQDLLPSIASPDGNARLNANRMLRAKKILSYVAERIEANPEFLTDPNAPKPEEYLDLYCHDQLVHPNTTLATLRVHVWRTGGDVLLYYKANGRKEIKLASTVIGVPEKTKTKPDAEARTGSEGKEKEKKGAD